MRDVRLSTTNETKLAQPRDDHWSSVLVLVHHNSLLVHSSLLYSATKAKHWGKKCSSKSRT